MFTHTHEEVTVTCELIASVVEDSSVAEREDVEFASRYMVKLENSESGRAYEMIIDLEGNPGTSNAMHTVLEHLKQCRSATLDMLARVDMFDTMAIIYRIDEIRACILIVADMGLGNICKILRQLPEWDLDYGCYHIVSIDDLSPPEEEEEFE